MKPINHLKKEIDPFRQQLLTHPVYKAIHQPADLQTFMEHHVFAVWDFMSLLKSLQNALTCTSVPWVPLGDPSSRKFINEIVWGEESDEDKNGKPASHYELYLDAMQTCGANTQTIQQFVSSISKGHSVQQSLETIAIPQSVKNFVKFTFKAIEQNKPHITAAVFTFGREDLIPDMFNALVGDMNKKFPGLLTDFKYYLDRHIELDGDLHGPLSLQMVSNLCEESDEKWQECIQWSKKALHFRVELWNGILAKLPQEMNEAVV